jgi:hypothetical protein
MDWTYMNAHACMVSSTRSLEAVELARAPERAQQRLLYYSNVAQHDLVVERRQGRACEGPNPEDPLQIKNTRTGSSELITIRTT